MVRFAHMADVHLGGWKQPQLQDLNFQSFRKAIDVCIAEKLDFVLISGDLFDTAFPGIDILKEAFAEFKRLKDAKIPCFIIAGSHDYSVSGKTFLDVLEKAGFCENVENWEEKGESLILNPKIYKNIAIYGYPGKKSGLEILDLRRIKLNDAPGLYKIFMLHTTLDKAKGTIPMDSIETDNLPLVDYYALGHIHIDFQFQNFVYPGPIFPNNFQELEDLHHGSFYIVNTEPNTPLKKIELKIKDVVSVEIELRNALTATEKIISELSKKELEDKVVLLRLNGELETGTTSDIKFQQIEDFVKQKNAYFILKNTHNLKTKELEIESQIENSDNVEEEAINIYCKENLTQFNELILPLMGALSMEKQEGETVDNFTNHLLEGAKKVLKF